MPNKTAGTYLKLLLLSGERTLNSADNRDLGTVESIRSAVDKANLPKRFGQWGYYDFKGETGLELRFRKDWGIFLEGPDWTCDVHDFVDMWERRADLRQAELQSALDLYGDGVNLHTWNKDRVLKDCWEWATERVAQLEHYRSQIYEAVVRGRAEESNSQLEDGNEGTMNVGAEELKHEIESRNETSGPSERESDLENTGSHGAALCEEMCDPLGDTQDKATLPHEESHVGAISPDDEPASSSDGPSPENDLSMSSSSGDRQVSSSTEENGTDSLKEPQSVSPPRTFNYGSLGNPPRRTVTALGVVIVCAVILVLFVAGYVAAKAFSSGDALTERASGGKSSRGSTRKQDDVDDPDYKVRAVPDHESLGTRYLQSTSLHEASISAENVVIAGQIFTGYLGVNGSMADPTVAVFSLNRQFKTLRFLVGVPDEKKGDFTWKQPQSLVVIEGDGQVLKKVHIRPGVVVPVDQSVENVKALVISFSHPVVIVEGSVWR